MAQKYFDLDKESGEKMKTIMIAIPGAADYPAEELGGRTPFEIAKLPNLHYFSKIGKVGTVKLVADRLEPSADVTLLNFLGYDADKVYTGRGPLEAANLELKLEDNEVAFRMNFITESNGFLADATAGSIATKEAKALINFLNKKLASDFVRFFAGEEYRHIAVLKDSHGFEALSAKTVAPKQIEGDAIDLHLPKGPGEELLKKLMYDAKLLLQSHEINQVRLDLNENPANMIWLWGQGKRPQLEKFSDRFGLSGALLSDREYAHGIARIAGLTVLEISGAEDVSERYKNVGKLLIEVAQEKDFVCLTLEACHEAAEDGDYKGKVSALEAMDFFIFSKVREFMENSKDVRVLVSPCHTLPWKMKKCTRDAVPFVMAGKNIMPDDIEKFSELTAKASNLKFNKGSDLLKQLFQVEAKPVLSGKS